MQNNKIISFFRALAVWSLVLTPVAALLAFLPVELILVDGTKTILIGFLVSIALISYFAHSFAEKKFSMPHIAVTAGVGIFFVTYLVSALMSDNIMYSFFGLGLEMWTVMNIFFASAYVFLVATYAQDEKVRFKISYALILAAVVAIASKVILRFLPGSVSVFNMFASGANPSNTVGRWFDFGFVSIALALVALLYVSSKAFTIRARIALWITVAFGLVAYTLTSSLLGALLLSIGAFLVYRFTRLHTDGNTYDTSARSIVFGIGFLAALIFAFQLITGQSPLFYQNAQIPTFATQFINYRDYPSNLIQETIPVLKGILTQNPVFGAGPNLFQDAWNMYKNPSVIPAERGIQTTVWWQTEFSYGGGMLLSVLGHAGILGLLGLLVALFMIIHAVYKNRAVFSSTRGYAILMLSMLGVVYATVHTPSVGLWFALLTVWGLTLSYCTGLVYETKSSKYIAIAVLAVLVVIVPLYGYATRTFYIVSALMALSSADSQSNTVFFKDASVRLQAIANTMSHSVYAQAVVSLEQTRARTIIEEVNAKQKELSQEQIQMKAEEVTEAYAIANRFAEQGAQLYPQNYAMNLLHAQTLAVLSNSQATTDAEKAQIENWYTRSKNAFAKARTQAPTNPNIDMLEADLAIAKNDITKAEELLVNASNKQPLLTQPLLTLTQIKVAQKDLDTARQLARRAVEVNPQNVQSLYVYGQLERQAKNFQNAEIAFRGIAQLQSPNIQPQVARLLADTYVEAGQIQVALPIYEEILKQNPSDTEVKAIIDRIKQPPTPEPTNPVRRR